MKRDDEHKTVKSKDVKEEEVARVPIAFAMVRLMQSLPQEVMETNLPGCVYQNYPVLVNRSDRIGYWSNFDIPSSHARNCFDMDSQCVKHA